MAVASADRIAPASAGPAGARGAGRTVRQPQPGAIMFDPDSLDGLLASWPVGRLAMVSADGGGPWVAPVVFAPARGAVWTPIDGKRKSGGPLARLANAAADPRAALLLDEYAEDWSRLWWVRVDGAVRVHRIGPSPEEGPAEEAVAALRAKYPQYRETPLFSGPPTLLELTIARWRGWKAADAPSPPPGPAPTSPGRQRP